MKKIVILSLSALIFSACGGAATTNQPTGATNANATTAQSNTMVSSHSKDNPAELQTAPRSDTKSKWTQGGNPIDTSKFDTEIAAAEKEYKAKPKEEGTKKALATAYVNRALALTDARQYASALGDYRRAQKLDPTNDEANKWIEQIVGIYSSMNKEYPKEGEEPPPLPFNKDAAPAANTTPKK
ncbi:MAG: tetratricopeptide repeat protein [Acidobacteria bacterium]|nr:tetratricopeptide repeat protein [Acidobacteriota bacterium]